ncbi:hypothetical protein [Streptomyces sp. NPDC003006]
MATRILPAVGGVEAARALSMPTGRLPGAEPLCAVVVGSPARPAVIGEGGESTVPPRDRTYTLDEDK